MVVSKLNQHFFIFTMVLLTSNLCFSTNNFKENKLYNKKDYYHGGNIASHFKHHSNESLSTEKVKPQTFKCAYYSDKNTLKTLESFSIEYPSHQNEINKTTMKWLNKIIYKNPASTVCNKTTNICYAIWQNRSSSTMNKRDDSGLMLNSGRGCL